MADLSFIEKNKFESLFGMKNGYVLDFSDKTFQEFISESISIDIYDAKYNYRSGSKANRLRCFWDEESNYLVGKLLDSLLQYWHSRTKAGYINNSYSDKTIFYDCKNIVERLKRDNPVENINALQPNNDDRDFLILSKSIKDSIEENEPEVALDRLHTFVIKYVRELCNKHSISFSKGTPLHSLFGGYVKHLVKENKIESKMTELILNSSINVLESFNDIRNNKSLAHDNPILNYDESILIFNDVSNVIKFIESLEQIPVG
ncbi:MAG: abortive infection family protein [Bacteroidetes bacterium]|nr:abortive infection family protein [Bacteroidota bacterium]